MNKFGFYCTLETESKRNVNGGNNTSQIIQVVEDRERPPIKELLEGYNIHDLALGGLVASHSTLDVCEGAQSERLRNFAIVRKGREKTYTTAFRTRLQGTRRVGCVQKTYLVDSWNQVPSEEVIEWIRSLNGIGVPSRSLGVYLRSKNGTYNSIMGMKIPMFGGNPGLLRSEERALPYKVPRNQDFLAERANLPVPPNVDDPRQINKPYMVKASQFAHVRDFERGFVVVKSPEEYQAKLDQLLTSVPEEKKAYAKEVFLSAPIQEYIPGDLLINLNFFYSRVWEDLEPLGTDTRRQFGNFEEAIHIPISLRESLWEQAIEMAYALFDTAKKYYPPGIVGPFAIQCMGDAKERLRPVDLCFRIAGSPDIGITPSANYLHGNGTGNRVDYGRRIAMELNDAIQQGVLEEVLM